MDTSSPSSSSANPSVTQGANIKTFLANEIRHWPEWWRGLSRLRKWGPFLFVAAYWPALIALGDFRSDHIIFGAVVIVLSVTGRVGAVLLRFLLPLILTAVIYDSMRFYADYIRGAIRVQEPYFFDKRFFGIATENGVLTPNEWWQLHIHPAIDLVTGFAYMVFIGIFVLTSAYYYFWLSRRGTRIHSAQWIRERSPAVMWSFFWVNILGYSTYYWYPAAPPWYVSLYGLGPADLSARPNPAGCIRFDQMLGTHFFTGFYGRSADVFGAIPSLHVAYPLITVYFAYRYGSLRTFGVLFYALMCFSAVYLNHHYVLDILWGSAYALITAVIVDRYFNRKAIEQRVRLDVPA